MSSLSEWFAEAMKHHQAHRYPEAESLYQRIVESDPCHTAA
jgi:hypothetical protein